MGITAALAIAYYGLNDLAFHGYLHPHFPALVDFFFFQSLLISWMLSMAERNRDQFPVLALGSVALRFMTALVVLIVFMLMEVENIQTLTIQFMAIYLIYLVFEIIVVLANLRRN